MSNRHEAHQVGQEGSSSGEERVQAPLVNPEDLDDFTRGYLECALWSSTDNSRDDGGDPLDDNYGIEDFSESALRESVADCKAFQSECAALLTVAENAGHAGVPSHRRTGMKRYLPHAAIFAIVVTMDLTGLLGGFDFGLMDWRLAARDRPASGSVVVVEIDERSLQQLNVFYRRYLAIVPISFLLAAMEVYVISSVARDGDPLFLVLPIGLGGGLGCVCATKLQHWLHARRTAND